MDTTYKKKRLAEAQKYLDGCDEDYLKQRSFQLEIEKIYLQQIFVCNWSALVALPTAATALLKKEEIINVVFWPMVMSFSGLLSAFITAILLHRAIYNIMIEYDRSADRWAGEIVKIRAGKITDNMVHAEQMKTGETAAIKHLNRAKKQGTSAYLFAAISVLAFSASCIWFGFNVANR